MSNLVEKLIEAQKVLRQSGVVFNRWTLPSCQSVYTMKEGSVVQHFSRVLKSVVVSRCCWL